MMVWPFGVGYRGLGNDFDSFLRSFAPPGALGRFQIPREQRDGFFAQRYGPGRMEVDRFGRQGWRTEGGGFILNPQDSRMMGPAFPQLATTALSRDIQEQQSAADRQFERNQQQIGNMEELVGGLAGADQRILGGLDQLLADMALDQAAWSDRSAQAVDPAVTQQRVEEMLGRMDRIQDTSGVSKALEASGDVLDRVMQEVEGSDRRLDDAIKTMEAAASKFEGQISEFGKKAYEEAAAISVGVQRRFHNQMKMLEGGIRPDGTPMTAAEQDALRVQLQGQAGQVIAETAAPILARAREVKAQLQTQLASMRTSIGQAKMAASQISQEWAQKALQIAGIQSDLAARDLDRRQFSAYAEGLRAQIAATLEESQIKREEIFQRGRELAGSLAMQSVAARQAAILDATRLRMQGLGEVARLVQQNPETVVSYFQGLLSLYQLMSSVQGRALVY